MKTAIIRKEHFNAAHRLHNPAWTDELNAEVFGKCNNPNYHGHNYVLEVKLIGEVDAETGFVMDVNVLKSLIKSNVLDPYDHKNLNLDVAEFKTLNPTVFLLSAKASWITGQILHVDGGMSSIKM